MKSVLVSENTRQGALLHKGLQFLFDEPLGSHTVRVAPRGSSHQAVPTTSSTAALPFPTSRDTQDISIFRVRGGMWPQHYFSCEPRTYTKLRFHKVPSDRANGISETLQITSKPVYCKRRYIRKGIQHDLGGLQYVGNHAIFRLWSLRLRVDGYDVTRAQRLGRVCTLNAQFQDTLSNMC